MKIRDFWQIFQETSNQVYLRRSIDNAYDYTHIV